MTTKPLQCNTLDFLLEFSDPNIIYDRVGLLAETIGWGSVLGIYKLTTQATLKSVIEKFVVSQVSMGTNRELMKILLSLNQMSYVRLFMKIRAETGFPDSLSGLLSPLAEDDYTAFWENAAACWLVRGAQVAQIEVISKKSIVERAADIIKDMVAISRAGIVNIIGYDMPVLMHPVSSPLLPFSHLSAAATIDLKKLYACNPGKNLLIVISESVYSAFGTEDLAGVFIDTAGIVVIIELSSANLGRNIYTKYGLDTYHIRTDDPVVLKTLFNNPDEVFRNIYRF